MVMDDETAKQIGWPKLRLPASEKACDVIFRNLVHLTTSQGASGASAISLPPCDRTIWEESEDWRECGDRKAGDAARDEGEGEVNLELKRRSKGCRAPEGVRGVFVEARGLRRGRRMGSEDAREPWTEGVSSGIEADSEGLARSGVV